MALETFEAGYAGARPERAGASWSGMWKLAQMTDRMIDGKWPGPWSATGARLQKTHAISSGESSPNDVQFNDDGTKFYIVGSAKDTIYQYSCSTAWDVSTASYVNKSFFVGLQETTPLGLFFKPDGTKFYIVGSGSDTVYQYSCSTAWDVSTASYDSVSFSVFNQESTPTGLAFKSDGTKFYVIGSTADRVYQYSCSTAWDVSTASYDGASYFVRPEELIPTGLFFKSDGTKFYVIGSTNDTVYQYSCSTAWDVSTASYDSVSFSVFNQESTPTGLFFKPDGTVFYILGESNDAVVQYSCSTAWDVSTASYSDKGFGLRGGEELIPVGIQFSDDGTKLYIVGGTNDQVYQYSCSTAWDVSTASYVNKSFFVGIQNGSAGGLFFKSDGTKFYTIDNSTDSVYQYSCSTAWDVSTASYDSVSFSVSAQEIVPQGLFFKSDGTKFYIIGTSTDTVYQYSCSTAWDISTASYDSVSFSASQETSPHELFFKSDGTKFYIVGIGSRRVYQYSCSTAWDVSTASYDSVSFSVNEQETSPRGLFFKSDGTEFYIVGGTNATVYQYSCSTAWDVSTASTYDSVSFSVNAQETAPSEIFFKSDGTKFYIVGSGSDTVYQYSCSTAWDVSTASYDSVSFSVSAQETAPTGLFFKSDGTKFYLVGNSNPTVHQYSCSTAWDVSTASYDSVSFSVGPQETTVHALFFKSDGTKFYIVGSSNDTVFQYSCSTAWDISTASYGGISFSVGAQDSFPFALFFKSDGTKFYILGSINDNVYQYSCSTAWDISTASYDSVSFSVASEEGSPAGLAFKSDGTKFYVVGGSNDTVYQYSTASAWEIASPFYDNKFFVIAKTKLIDIYNLFFKPDGTKFYIVTTTSVTVYQYSCSTAWDVSTASYDGVSFSVRNQDSNLVSLFFKSDGTKFYILGSTTDNVYQYSCSTAWDVSTASYDGVSFSFSLQDGGPTSLFFKPDGTKFYILGNTNDTVYQYSCSTAWDISTAFYDLASFGVNTQEPFPTGLFFKSDGTKFYILGLNVDEVHQYSCSTAWDVSTSSYDDVSFSVNAQDPSPYGLSFKSDGTAFYIGGANADTVFQYSVLLQ